ncbi:MAG: MlaD family protein [Rhizobacter sp.]|nr:MlaD family protein [Rhizobacter sp.]
MSPPPELPPPADAPPVAHLDLKARLLLVGVLVLIGVSIAYVLYARGAFERKQTLVLVADNSEGVVVGQDLTFAGFPIGRVNRIELSKEGNARIVVDVPVKDANWLRESSVFTMESGLVGAPKIRAYSGVPSDPPLPDGAVRRVLSGDASAEIPRLMASVRDLIANLTSMTSSDAPLNRSLRNVQTTTETLNSPRGALGVLMGDDKDAKKIITTLDRTNALLARIDGLVLKADGLAVKADGFVTRADGLVAKADTQVFGERGVMKDAHATVAQLNGLLGDARNSLTKVDALLQEAQGIAGNTREATTDLIALRAEVEASLRKVAQLVNEVNRKWPFARDTEIKLP